MSLKAISFDSLGVRAAAVGVGAAALLVGVLGFLWAVVNTAALGAESKEVGQQLSELSPDDPQTHFTSAVQHEKSFDPADLSTALTEYEKAAALSPYNYLIWLELGSARGRAGETPAAEAALRRARELAPNYARVQWALGNLLLRKGSEDEAYAEMRKAIEGDPAFALPAAAIALQMSNGDPGIVQARFQGLPHAEVALASLLAGQKKFDEAAKVWSSIKLVPGDEKLAEAAKALKLAFFSGRRFRTAATIAAQMTDTRAPVIGAVTNPGFELPVRTEGFGEFDWRVSQTNFPQIAVTGGQKRTGRYSLIALFNNPEARDFRGFAQTIAVQPGTAYELGVQYRADVRSKAPFHWEIVSAGDSKRLALSTPLSASTDWTGLSTRFTVPPDVDGIEIRFVRGDCVAAACTASGSFWFDDISISAK
jgi:Tfp pilus assembly protein PilF